MMFVARGEDSGLGAGGTQIVSAGGTIAGSALSTGLILSGAVAGPVGLLVGGVVAGVASLLGAMGVGGGCGQSCIVASQNANQVEDAMKANLAAFQAGQISRDEALANFDTLWAHLQQVCGQIGGGAGQNCISDRQEGACKWKDAQGECWNWFKGYRDPIATAQETISSNPVAAIESGVGSNPLLWIGGAIAAVALAEAL